MMKLKRNHLKDKVKLPMTQKRKVHPHKTECHQETLHLKEVINNNKVVNKVANKVDNKVDNKLLLPLLLKMVVNKVDNNKVDNNNKEANSNKDKVNNKEKVVNTKVTKEVKKPMETKTKAVKQRETRPIKLIPIANQEP